MYSSFQLFKKYIHYLFTASNGKGHGIHSPFVFDFIKNVLNDRRHYACYREVETIRDKLLRNQTIIHVEDFGAGSAVNKTNTRAVNRIAASSLKSKKYARLLFRIIQYYRPKTIVELGTSFGVTTAYLASGSADARVYTLEGSSSIAAISRANFEELGLKNIKLTEGNFNSSLPGLLAGLQQIDFAFIDGNHRKVPTLDYFKQLLQYSSKEGMLIFDDIHWSNEMEEAWEEIKGHDGVMLTIDLFFIGLVFINPGLKEKQHFSIQF